LSRTSRNGSVDCIIVLDEPSNDPLKKRLDASSSLLSSFADPDSTALKYVVLFCCGISAVTLLVGCHKGCLSCSCAVPSISSLLLT